MIMMLTIDKECNRDLRVDTSASVLSKISIHRETEAVRSSAAVRAKIAATSVSIGRALTQSDPSLIHVLLKMHMDFGRRLAQHGVQNMRGNCAHTCNHFLRRICVI